MKSIILAAGTGQRLKPYTDDKPKCLVEVQGKPLLQYQLRVLQQAGIQDVVMICGYREAQLAAYPVRRYINVDYESTNMVHTLFCARNELQGTVILSYGDIVYSKSILDTLKASPFDISVVVDKAWKSYWHQRFSFPLQDAETLKIDRHGKIVEIGQKPSSYEEIEAQYIGLMKFSNRGLSWLIAVYDESQKQQRLNGKNPKKAYMTDLLQAVITSGYPIHAVPIVGEWIEIDTVEDLTLNVTNQRISEIQKTLSSL